MFKGVGEWGTAIPHIFPTLGKMNRGFSLVDQTIERLFLCSFYHVLINLCRCFIKNYNHCGLSFMNKGID